MGSIDPKTEAQIQRLLENGVKLPGLTGMGAELMAQLRKPVESIVVSRLAEQIETEPTLSARILRVANSPAYGAMRGVTRISQAVMVMGLEETLSIVNYYILRRMFNKAPNLAGFCADDFWRHSLAVANTARLLGQPRYLVQSLPGELYTSGLLHDIGKMVLASHLPEPYSEALEHAQSRGALLVETEREMLGVDHATLAGQLLDNWNLPYSILDGIACHHDPEDAEPENRERAALIEYADVLAVACGAPKSAWGAQLDLSQTWICRNRPDSPLASESVQAQLERDVTAMIAEKNKAMEDGEDPKTEQSRARENAPAMQLQPALGGAAANGGLWGRVKSWFA